MWKSMEEMTVLQAVQAPKICKYLAMFMSIALIVQAACFMFWFPLAQPLYYISTSTRSRNIVILNSIIMISCYNYRS